MADETAASPANPATTTTPSFSLVGQYIRDLSFENPNAPTSVLAGSGNPGFSVNINVGVKKQADDLYAVELTLNAKAEREGNMLFNVELVYGGVFRMRNIPEANLPPLLMVEAPRLIFPFARQVLANVTQQGGFPPVMMEPVDFNAIFRQNLANLQNQARATAPNGSGGTTPPVTSA